VIPMGHRHVCLLLRSGVHGMLIQGRKKWGRERKQKQYRGYVRGRCKIMVALIVLKSTGARP